MCTRVSSRTTLTESLSDWTLALACTQCVLMRRSCYRQQKAQVADLRFLADAMKERGLLPLPAAPPIVMIGSIEVPRERARRPLNGSVCRKTVCGNRSAPTPDCDRPDHRSW